MDSYPQLRNELNPEPPPGGGCPGDNNDNEQSNQETNENLTDFGQLSLPAPRSNIHVITIIGQVEGHLVMPSQNKATKYEHIIPQLVAVEQLPEIEGLIVVLNTVGGDVEAGLAIAEIIATMSKPTVSLVLGGGHSIGVPIAVAAERSFIASTATMTIHPIRLTGMVIGAQQSFDYMSRMQERIVRFVCEHSRMDQERFEKLMMTSGQLAQDLGTVLIGREAVDQGLIDQVGGLRDVIAYLQRRIDEERAAREGAEPANGEGEQS